MSKIIFNNQKVSYSKEPVIIKNSSKQNSSKKDEKLEYKEYELNREGEVVGEYKSPTIREIELEIKNYREKIEKQTREYIKKAEEERKEIVDHTEKEVILLKQESDDYITEQRRRIEEEREKKLESVKQEAQEIVENAQQKKIL